MCVYMCIYVYTRMRAYMLRVASVGAAVVAAASRTVAPMQRMMLLAMPLVQSLSVPPAGVELAWAMEAANQLVVVLVAGASQ